METHPHLDDPMPQTTGDQLPEFERLEAADPEGAGRGLRLTPRFVVIVLLISLLVLAARTSLTWALEGRGTALVVAVAFLLLCLVIGLPIGCVVLLRHRVHTQLEHKAVALHVSSIETAAAEARDAQHRAIDEHLNRSAADRLTDDGGPAASDATALDPPLRRT